MTHNATTLRTLVMDNALTLGRLNADTIGKDDYKTLSDLYRTALNALTEWAGLDYAHKSDKNSANPSFDAVKAILELFATDEDKIIIDQSSMRTLRDCATKPKRLYSAEYTKAEKSRKAQAKTVAERYTDLITLGAPVRNDEETVEDYATRVRETGIDTNVGAVDMLEMFINASAFLVVKEKAVKDIKDKGNWTWRRPVATDLNTFADLVENYIADCLMDGYNIKSYNTVCKEQAEARKLAKAEKAEQTAA